RIHAVEKLLNRVDAEFTAFVAVERKANSDVLGQFQEHRFIGLFVRRLSRESGESLLESVLSANRHSAKPRLEGRHIHLVFAVLARLPKLGKETEHRTNIVFCDVESGPATWAAYCARASRAASAWRRRRVAK